MRRAAAVLLVLFAACAAQAAQAQQAQPLDRIVAVVENDTITERELRGHAETMRRGLERQGKRPPDGSTLRALALQNLVTQKLQLQEAERLGIAVDELALDRAMEEVAARNDMTPAELLERVEREGGNYAELREQVRNDIILKRLVQREVVDRIEVAEAEVEALLAERAGDGSETQYNFAMISVPSTDAAALAAAKGARRALRIHKPLTLARLKKLFARAWKTARAAGERKDAESEDAGPQAAAPPYRIKDLGWRAPGRLPRPLDTRAAEMSSGGVSPIVKRAGALRLYHLLATRNRRADMNLRKYRVRHILLQPDLMRDDDDLRRRLFALRRAILQGQSFAELANTLSEDPGSNFKGGELGWITTVGIAPEFAQMMRETPAGRISRPFKTAFGWHILQIMDTREEDAERDLVRNQAIAELRKRETPQAVQRWLLELRRKRHIDIRI